MKNAIKISLLAIAVSLSAAACNGNKPGGSADSAKVDSSSSVKTTDTTIKADTTKPAGDTVSKTATKSEVKKSVVKKN